MVCTAAAIFTSSPFSPIGLTVRPVPLGTRPVHALHQASEDQVPDSCRVCLTDCDTRSSNHPLCKYKMKTCSVPRSQKYKSGSLLIPTCKDISFTGVPGIQISGSEQTCRKSSQFWGGKGQERFHRRGDSRPKFRKMRHLPGKLREEGKGLGGRRP